LTPAGRDGRLNGMESAISITIDAAGRVVVPKAIRDRAGLRPGMELHIRYRDGRVEIEPAPRSVEIVERGGLRVAEPRDAAEPLTQALVSRTREGSRTARKPW